MQQLEMLKSINDLPSTDGRVARGERTRVRVADALISLLEEGETAPTAKMVAQRAGVSLRLVFHHYEDMDALYRAVMVLQAQRYWSRVRDIPPDLPFTQRVDRVGPAAQPALRSHQPGAAGGGAPGLSFGRAGRQRSPSPARSYEVASRSPSPPSWRRPATAPRIFSMRSTPPASWEVWERLRLGQRLSAVATRRVMARTLRSLLEATAEQADGAEHGARHPRRRAARHGSRTPDRRANYR